MKISIDYIARVEGEGAIKFDIEDGVLKDLKLNIWEPPRFFEGFLCNRRYDEVPDIVARICGICPVSHMTTAIRALEKALGFTPAPDSITLRKVMALSQIVSSHLVHLYMLALPDYYRLYSIPDMFPRFEPEIRRLNRMKKVVNEVTALFGGRALHPVSMVVGGFTSLPPRDKIEKIKYELENIKDDAKETLRMVSDLLFPDLTHNTEYVAISSPPHYAINEGFIISQNGVKIGEDEYYSIFKEDEVSYSNAKRTVIKGKDSFMVGALARLNLKFDLLHEDAKEAAEEIGFKVPDYNPFHNNLAQAIEIVHGISECRELLDKVILRKPEIGIKVREGEGRVLQ